MDVEDMLVDQVSQGETNTTNERTWLFLQPSSFYQSREYKTKNKRQFAYCA